MLMTGSLTSIDIRAAVAPRLCLAMAVGLLGLCISPESFAAEADSVPLASNFDLFTEQFRVSSAQWQSVLLGYAITLFWMLAGIEFSFAAISLAFKGSDFQEWVTMLVNQILFIGFFFTLLLNSPDWSQSIVASFQQAASSATAQNGAGLSGSVAGVTPAEVFDQAFAITNIINSNAELWNIFNLGIYFSSVIIIITFSLITAFMIMTIIESYIVISGGVLFMGFGGSRWTREYAQKIIVYALSVGAKLFILQLIVGLGMTVLQAFASQFRGDSATIYMLIGGSIVLLALTTSLPDLVQSLILGVSSNTGFALLGSAAVATTIAAKVAAATGGTARSVAGTGSALAAAKTVAQSAINPNDSVLRKTAGMATGMAKNLAKAAKDDFTSSGSGPVGGTIGGRMSEHIKSAAALKDVSKAPGGSA